MNRRLPVLASLLAAVLIAGGCVSSSHWGGEQTVRMGVRADRVSDLESRLVPHAIDGDVVRIRNLAGAIVIEQADVPSVQVDATVYARGRGAEHTRALINAMTWTEHRDDDGGSTWMLSWPVETHQVFHYSTAGRGFEMSTTRALDRRVTVTTMKNDATPTLFADLHITCPPGTEIHMKNFAGPVEAERIAGTFHLGTAAGSIDLGTFEGDLVADTGSGPITAGTVHGTAHLDTGSGDITVHTLRAEATLDTGSGDIVVHAIDCPSVRADTGSGRIVLRDGHANRIVADTGSGDIRIENVAFDHLHADTGSGDVTIASALTGAGSIHADTGSGDVTILAGDDASFDLHASIGSGRIKVGYDDARIRHNGRKITGAVRGDGATRIHVDTGSGDCAIRPRS